MRFHGFLVSLVLQKPPLVQFLNSSFISSLPFNRLRLCPRDLQDGRILLAIALLFPFLPGSRSFGVLRRRKKDRGKTLSLLWP